MLMILNLNLVKYSSEMVNDIWLWRKPKIDAKTIDRIIINTNSRNFLYIFKFKALDY